MRRRVLIAVAVTLAASAVAGEPADRVVLLREPDGTPRIVNAPGRAAKAAVRPAATARRDALWPHVEKTARAQGVDHELVDLVIRMESGYNPNAVRPKGARGVMQLMPGTARQYGVRDVFDPHENIGAGVRYLSDLLQRYGNDTARALAAYNAGPEAVERFARVPPYRETRHYVATILGAYEGTPAELISGGFAARSRPRRPVSAQGKLLYPELNEKLAYGKPASTPALDEIWAIWRADTKAAGPWLDSLTAETLQLPLAEGIPNIGTFLLRTTYHYWYHLGEAMAVRQMLAHSTLPDFVGNIDSKAPYSPE